ncbi:MAG: ATP-dependent Clp protease ATP-binding subunit ClpX, partial [Candidatus Kapabacteria bacterium]|nr:ATP-dependent Clp protease ATP-binding subunit ClpX [Candidatus Kapabacteria bacterium]
ELEFRADALQVVVDNAQKRKSGARGLRSIMEEAMLPIMYKIPDMKHVRKCIITRGVIEHKAEPEYLLTLDEPIRKVAS